MTRARIGWAVVVLAAVAVGAVFFFKGKAPKAPQFVTATVDKGPLQSRVTATGTLSALVTVQVGAQVSGRIASLHADFNSSVKKNQVLAQLDPSLLEAATAQAKANEQAALGNLARAKAQAADAERQLARSQQLSKQNLIAQAEVDTALAARDMAVASVTAAEGSLAQARAQRHQADVNLTYATVRSPIDGTVISRAVDVGQTVAASLQAPTLFTIAESLTSMQVDTSIAEADVGKLKEGLAATFTVDACPGRAFEGRIRQMRFAPQVVSNVVTYDAVIDVANPELLLRPGMTANVTFVTAKADEVLRVPNAALRFKLDDTTSGKPDGARAGGPRGRPDGGTGGWVPGQKAVYVLRDGLPVRVQVQLGLSDGTSSEVTSGELQEGDLVIVDKQGDGASSGGAKPQGGGNMGGMRRVF